MMKVHVAPMPWIIPADAGSTRRNYTEHYASRDHPRGCGEHIYELASDVKSLGSSPRMRGALQHIP